MALGPWRTPLTKGTIRTDFAIKTCVTWAKSNCKKPSSYHQGSRRKTKFSILTSLLRASTVRHYSHILQRHFPIDVIDEFGGET